MLPRLLSLVSGQEWWWLIIVGCAILHHFAYCHKLLSLNSICTCLYHFEYVHCVWSCVPLPATLVVSIAFSQPPLVLHMRLNLSVYSEDATWKTAFGYSINVRSLIQWYPFNTNFSLLSTCLLLRRLNLLLQMEMKMKTSISYSYILFFFLSFPTSSGLMFRYMEPSDQEVSQNERFRSFFPFFYRLHWWTMACLTHLDQTKRWEKNKKK